MAHHLAKALMSQHEIINIYSRSFDKAADLAQVAHAKAVSHFKQLNADVDLVMIAVSDQSIPSVILALTEYLPNVLIVHTSGSTALSVLATQHARAGVFYPLQTFSLEREIDWSNTPLFVEATENTDLQRLHILAESLCQRVYS